MAFSLPFFKKKQENHIYFGLYFTESRINGFAYDILSGKANILAQNGYDITTGYEKIIQDVDNLISDLESNTNQALDKTIFFLHSTMLDGTTHEIREPYKGMLKNISKELELEPMGYIDVHESIEGNLKEHSIINNVLLEVSQNQLSVFIYKGGILTTSQTISRTDSIAADLNSILKSFPNPVILPTKIILYGVGDLTKASSDIAQFKWDEKIFVQQPVIEILKDSPLHQILADTFVQELLTQGTAPSTPLPPASATTPTATLTADTSNNQFGFVFGQDVSSQPVQPSVAVEPELASDSFFDKVKMYMGGNAAKIIGVIIAILVIVVGLFFGYEYFVHAATVEVTVETNELSEKLELTLPIAEKPNSKELSVIKHTKVTEFDDEKGTTGKREIGEKAKGDIIIHNFDNSEKTISRGTKLTYKSLTYSLDTEVKVASSSGISSDGVKQSGKAKGSVTASDIGPDFNIAKGSQLTIDSLAESLFIAIADSAFSGGTKKQVTTVSKSDMEALKENAEEEVKKKSTADLGKSIAKDEVLLEDLTIIEVTDTEYSGEVGEEAKNIKIKASTEVEFYTVDKKQFIESLGKLLDKEKKQDYSIDSKNIAYKIKEASISKDDEEVELVVQATTKEFKSIDPEAVKEKITFKSASSLEPLLKDFFHVEKVAVSKSSPPIPFLSSWLPLFKKNITVTTSTN